MTSNYAIFGDLSERTRDIYRRYGSRPRTLDERVDFYLALLKDVVPGGITVHHVPEDPSSHDGVSPRREEIQLLTYSGKVFMSGLVTMDRDTTETETVAGSEAYTKWLDGDFIDHNWRFFTASARLKFFGNCHRDEWERMRDYHPVTHADLVAAFLQNEYNRLVLRQQY